MKRLTTCLIIILLCAATPFSQTRRNTRPAQTSIKHGYYFTVDMCRACYYPEWRKDVVRLFQQQGIGATIYEGAMMETANERFVSLKIFPKRGMWSDVVYVGPFASEEVAVAALDKFPAVLGTVQRKRNKMGGSADEGWLLEEGEKVRRTKGNDYKYGFYEIKGCRLVA
ncbi:MAG: hypothetical protein MSG64_01380 [Pyrinomonadaceae bacterium MAG19_C2-C3]|nr:hypothetical protein [Pyrinomonadaceae bacterium MAG19_C2-C3]